jgi:hypothetical protein
MNSLSLTWDGSHLGEYPRSCLLHKIQCKDSGIMLQYIRLPVEEDGTSLSFVCHMKRHKDVFLPCILDEIKPLFGISKIGTHRIRIGKLEYVLYKCFMGDRLITKLSNSEKENIKEILQPQILYRVLFCVEDTKNASFIYRCSIDKHRKRVSSVFSFCEIKTTLGKERYCPTETFITHWFGDNAIDEYLTEFIENLRIKYKKEDTLQLILWFQSEIETIIQRINKEYIWITSHLTQDLHKICNSNEY